MEAMRLKANLRPKVLRGLSGAFGGGGCFWGSQLISAVLQDFTAFSHYWYKVWDLGFTVRLLVCRRFDISTIDHHHVWVTVSCFESGTGILYLW